MADLSYSAIICIIIVGVGIAFMLVYGVWRMVHRDDRPFVGLSNEQEQYMREVRQRNLDDLAAQRRVR